MLSLQNLSQQQNCLQLIIYLSCQKFVTLKKQKIRRPYLLKRILYTVISTFLFQLCFAQQPEIESIYKRLPLAKDSIAYVDLLNRLSIIYYLKNADSCYFFARKAYDISDRYNYTKGLADALNNTGIYYSLKTNTYVATKYYNESLELYRQIHDTANEAQLLMNIGIELAMNQKKDEALDYLYKAYNMSKGIQHDSIHSLAVSNILYYNDKLPKDSFELLMNEGKAVAKKYKDIRMEMALDQNAAQLLIDKGNTDSAINLLKTLVPVTENLGMQYEVIALNWLLGNAFMRKDTMQAVAYYKQALASAQNSGYTDATLQSADTLYTLFKHRNDVVNAAAYADILINASKDYQRFIKESGINYLDYIGTGKQLVVEKQKNKDRLFLTVVLLILFIVGAAMLLISYRAYQSSKRYSTSLQELNNMIYKKNKQLEQNNEFKDKLISLLAHDFRQPLVSLSSLVTLLKDHEKLSSEEMDRVLESIENSSKSSMDIFENILQWIKKQLSGFSYTPDVFPLITLIEEAAEVYKVQIQEKSLRFNNLIDKGITIHAEREMIQFINRNLIHNAIKFSHPHSEISISAYEQEKEVVVAVKDSGKGMNSEKIQSLFNFLSAKSYSNNSEKGAGVALVICKDFIDKMHGRLWAESEQNKGTVFYYSLPRLLNGTPNS